MAKILLIEDDETMQNLLRTLLRIEGFDTVNLSGDPSMEYIIDLMRQENPDLVMIDVNLRQFNGIDLLTTIRQQRDLNDTRVLMTSGMDYTDRCKEAGADGFMLKPYMPEDLIRNIRQMVGEEDNIN